MSVGSDDSANQSRAPDIQSGSHGARTGFVILALLIAFVAIWMTLQGRPALQNSTITELSSVETPAGFRADVFQLPDEALLGFVEIPAGTFLMGSDPSRDRQAYENERWSSTTRQGNIELARFYVGRYEVTVAQYLEFVADTNRAVPDSLLSAQPDLPVTNVTWTDALAYGRWLESRLLEHAQTPEELRTLLNTGWHISLPTEAQWEKAARGTDGAIYPWGDRLLEGRANFGSSAVVAVGSMDCPECQNSLADMSGNVWELTRSPYQPYPYSENDDRYNLSEDALWVMRGGSFQDGPGNIRAAIRGGVDPGVRNETIGFRLVLTPP